MTFIHAVISFLILGLFWQNNKTSTNSIYGQNTNNQPNNQPQNNNNGLFGQNNNTGGNTLFNARPQGAGIFGNNTQGGQNNANTSIFGANTQNQPNNQPNQMFNQPKLLWTSFFLSISLILRFFR